MNLKLPNCLIHGAADVSDEWDRQDGSSVAEEKKRIEGGGGALAVTWLDLSAADWSTWLNEDGRGRVNFNFNWMLPPKRSVSAADLHGSFAYGVECAKWDIATRCKCCGRSTSVAPARGQRPARGGFSSAASVAVKQLVSLTCRPSQMAARNELLSVCYSPRCPETQAPHFGSTTRGGNVVFRLWFISPEASDSRGKYF